MDFNLIDDDILIACGNLTGEDLSAKLLMLALEK
jgi:hypothetical protein